MEKYIIRVEDKEGDSRGRNSKQQFASTREQAERIKAEELLALQQRFEVAIYEKDEDKEVPNA